MALSKANQILPQTLKYIASISLRLTANMDDLKTYIKKLSAKILSQCCQNLIKIYRA